MAFWKKKEKRLAQRVDLSPLGADMHSHLVPGIDDGSTDMANSIELITELASFGYKKLLTTPHIMSDYYKNSSDIIKRGCEAVLEELAKTDLTVELTCSAEYYTDSHFEQLIKSKDLMPFGDNYILFELGFVAPPPQLTQVIFDLQMAGYRPILAHPERYNYWHGETDQFETLVNKGVLLQLNINSLSGVYGKGVKDTAHRLINEDLVSFLGTDCHHHGHIDVIRQVQYDPMLEKAMQSKNLLNAHI